MQLLPTIKKRNGMLEAFEPAKIKKVVIAAGLSSKQAEELLHRVTSWVDSLKEQELSSLKLRDKVLEELKRIYKPAADLFAWYQKTKEKHTYV